MANYTTTITNEGAALLASVIANQGTLTFNEFRFSENDYTGQESTLTEGTFLGVFITASAAASVIDLTTIKASAQFNNSTITGNHNLYSIGIVGTDGNTTALIAVCTTTDPDVIREPLTGTSTYAFNVNLTVSNTNDITVVGTTAAVLYDIDVVDTLISTATDKPLSANMGRVLADNLAANENVYGAKNLWDIEGWFNKYGQAFSKAGDIYSFTTSADLNSNVFKFADTDISVILSGVVTHSSSDFRVDLLDISNNVVGSLNSYISSVTGSGCKIRFYNPYIGQTVTIDSPMIRDSRVIDPTFVPFAETNLQLTQNKAERDDLATLKLTGSTNTTGATINKGIYFYLNGSYCRAKQYILNGNTFTLNTNFEVVNIGSELYGESGTFTLTPTGGTYTDGFISQTNNYVRVGGLCLIYGLLELAGNPDSSHNYVTCSGLPLISNSYNEIGPGIIRDNGKVSSGVIHNGAGSVNIYFDLVDGTYPTAGQLYQYTLMIRVY